MTDKEKFLAHIKECRKLKANEDGFKLVYQSGHVDTWCNGSEHRNCLGGNAGFIKAEDKTFVCIDKYKCNCNQY